MIVSIYGVPGLSFAEITYMLTELGIGFMAVSDKPQKIGEPTKGKVVPVVFASASVFYKNKDKIKFRAAVFVCDSYVKLKQECGWPMVGVVDGKKKNQHFYVQFHTQELGELLQRLDQFHTPLYGNIGLPKVYDPASEMIAKFATSALTQSQTMMYKIKDQETRSKTFELVRSWFTGTIKSKDVLKTKLRTLHTSQKYVDDLMAILLSSVGITLRRVTTEVRKAPEKLEAAAKRANLSPFDVRYLLSKGKR